MSLLKMFEDNDFNKCITSENERERAVERRRQFHIFHSFVQCIFVLPEGIMPKAKTQAIAKWHRIKSD